MKLPNFLIVGAAKCGTTSLYEYLRQHPEVFMSRRKEPNFFVGDPWHRNRATEQEYRALFEGADGFKAVGEASVAYLFDTSSAETIHRYLGPDTRILVLLRNPVDMAYALWGHMVRAGGETLGFLEALAAEPARLRDDEFQREAIGWGKSYAYSARARYAPQLNPYLARFGQDRVRVYLFEEFFRDLRTSFADVCRFLEVDANFVPVFKKHNPTGPVVSRRLRDAVQQRRPWKEPLKTLLPPSWRLWLKTKAYRLNRWNHVPLRPLHLDTRREVLRLFEDDIAELEGLLGRPLSPPWDHSSNGLEAATPRQVPAPAPGAGAGGAAH